MICALLNSNIIGDRLKRERSLAEYFLNSENTHNAWAVKMLIIDFLYLVNILFNIYFINAFLGYEFTTFGIDVVKFINDDNFEYRTDPMTKVFPRVTKSWSKNWLICYQMPHRLFKSPKGECLSRLLQCNKRCPKIGLVLRK